MLRTPVHLVALLTLSLALLAAEAPPAAAGTFTVHSCTTPDGTWTGMEGWSNDSSPLVPSHDPGSATPCTESSPMFILGFGLTGLPVASGRWVRWTFTASASTVIRSIDVTRGFNLAWPTGTPGSDRPYALQVWHGDNESANVIELRWPARAGATLTHDPPSGLSDDGASWRTVHVDLRCWPLTGSGSCGPFPAQVTIPRATFTLSDVSSPHGGVSGAAASPGTPVRGVAAVDLTAADAGAGVYRARLAVDGVAHPWQVLDANGGRCADVVPGNGDPYEFGSPQPCPSNVTTEIPLWTGDLADGAHTLAVEIEDAAGNVVLVHSGRFTSHNAPVEIVPPILSGEARVGDQLHATSGLWDGVPTSFQHRWLRCDAAGTACAEIPGAAGASYTLTAADLTRRIVAEVTAANANGSGTARSAASDAVVQATPSGPGDPGGPDEPPGGGGGGGDGGGSPGGGASHGSRNPLGDQPGHVPNGTGATAGARLRIGLRRPGGRSATRVRSPRDRRWTVAGRLVDERGAPIADALLRVSQRVVGRGWVDRGTIRTREDGSVAHVLPAGPSRSVRLVYFPFSDRNSPITSNAVRLEVLAGVTIRADRRHVTGARVVALSGRVAGERIPGAGLVVTLQGHQAGYGWRTFRTVRTDRRGAWRTKYQFRLSRGHFAFRAIVPQQGSFPYVTSRSRSVAVTVG